MPLKEKIEPEQPDAGKQEKEKAEQERIFEEQIRYSKTGIDRENFENTRQPGRY